MNKNMMALLNESLASMIGDVKKIGVFLFVAALTLSVLPAEAGSLPLSAGTYYCWTLTTMYAAPPSPDSPSEINRRAAGNNIRPMVAPGLLMAPAAFGNVILDGKGGYRMPTTKQVGKYGFNKATGLPTFTGDLGALKLIEYSGTGTSFVMRWETMNFQCALTGDGAVKPSTAIAPGTRAPNSSFVSKSGPALTNAQAKDFNGRFEGSYVCSSTETIMQLELQAKPNGTIAAIFKFGGVKTPELSYSLGVYSLKGTWRGAHYVLKSEQWIEQPAGYVMSDLEGDITTLGTSGVLLHSSCDSFALKRILN
jgi:hypothetical protein